MELGEAALLQVCKGDGFVMWPFPWGSFCLVSQPCSLFLMTETAAGCWKCELWASFQTLGQAFTLNGPGAQFARPLCGQGY